MMSMFWAIQVTIFGTILWAATILFIVRMFHVTATKVIKDND